MNTSTKSIIVITHLCLLLSSPASASPTCPIQGLDSKVCPIVVNFFDDVAKHNPDFAKHWQNHHWVSQNGASLSFQNLEMRVALHNTFSFIERKSSVNLEQFINDTLGKAAKSDPRFQQVIDSHNLFVMTVQAMHLALQHGADHFNKQGYPAISLKTNTPESVDIELWADESYQKPTTDRFLNNAGIYYTNEKQYQHSVHIDSTTYKAGSTVTPLVVGVLSPATPKNTKTTPQNQPKTVAGTTPHTGQTKQNPKPPSQTAPNSIQKNPNNRQRQGSPATTSTTPMAATSKTGKTSGSPPKKQILVVTVPTPGSNQPNKGSTHIPAPVHIGNSSPTPKGSAPIQAAATGSANSDKQNTGSIQPHHSAVRPYSVSVQHAPTGTSRNNINAVMTTQKAGSQTDINERTYSFDDNDKVWGCMLSTLGFRVTLNPQQELTAHGHFESAHVRSVQLAHIPANHAGGSGCLISVHK